MIQYIFWLVVLAVASFLQNMAFTWTSRSRNSGDPNYHRYAAWCSNGVWFVCHILVWKNVWEAFQTSDEPWWWAKLIPVAVVYIIATTEGSVLMMRILLKKEKGKQKVGAR